MTISGVPQQKPAEVAISDKPIINIYRLFNTVKRLTIVIVILYLHFENATINILNVICQTL